MTVVIQRRQTGNRHVDGLSRDAADAAADLYSRDICGMCSGFTMPAVLSSVRILAENRRWLVIGQTVFITYAGNFTVSSFPTDDPRAVVITNNGAATNAAAGTKIAGPQQLLPGGGNAGPTIAPDNDLNTLSLWKFDETSGGTAHNSGTVGDSSSTRLTLINSPATLGVASVLGRCLAINGGSAQGAASIEPAGPITIYIVFTPSSVPAFITLFAKSYYAPNTWAAPFKSIAASINADGTFNAAVTTSVTGTPTLYSCNTAHAVMPGQQNIGAVIWDNAGNLTPVLNGKAGSTRTGIPGTFDYGAHGNWVIGQTPVNSDSFFGYVHRAGIRTVIDTEAFYFAATKKILGASW